MNLTGWSQHTPYICNMLLVCKNKAKGSICMHEQNDHDACSSYSSSPNLWKSLSSSDIDGGIHSISHIYETSRATRFAWLAYLQKIHFSPTIPIYHTKEAVNLHTPHTPQWIRRWPHPIIVLMTASSPKGRNTQHVDTLHSYVVQHVTNPVTNKHSPRSAVYPIMLSQLTLTWA
jgi:hypothetical protein